MKRWVAVLAGCALVLASIGEGLLVWRFVRHQGPQYPEISAYSRGETVRVGPYLHCTLKIQDKRVLPTNCVEPQDIATLVVGEHTPVQLSVPEELVNGRWRLKLTYDDISDLEDEHPPGHSRAVTIPTFGPELGRLRQIVVGLPMPTDDVIYYAEWTVNTVWPDEKPAAAN
ncbi:MAG: DUF2771 domain-containing protein [Mycolicibacterium sp.]|nr:DUF2771 domain-containing protein [Mycolicibacterium sp.]